MMNHHMKRNWKFPDDAEAHFQELKEKTLGFRNYPMHEYANYSGPWLENIFISRFIDKPLSYFQGFIPIFVQWIDAQILRGKHFGNIDRSLAKIIRPDVIYLAISQGDVGLDGMSVNFPNILVLSAGGYGHVPIPLIRSEMEYVEPGTFTQDLSFFGEVGWRGRRGEMLTKVKKLVDVYGLNYKQGIGSHWASEMQKSRFNLAPSGYGRSSFRFTESIQMGRIPVLMYDDTPWIPYRNTSISVEVFGFIAGLRGSDDTIEIMIQKIQSQSQEDFHRHLKSLKELRKYYTYEGLMIQIEQFMRDPFGENGGYLRCEVFPRSERAI